MKRKIAAVILVVAMCFVTACQGGQKSPVQSDKKPETTESTVDDAIGEDSEIQMTTKKPDEESSEEPTASSGETTSKEENSSEESTTVKPTETSSKEQETTAKNDETTKQETTTKEEQQTTTSGEKITTAEQYTTNSSTTGNTRGEALSVVDFTPSNTAITKAKSIVAQITTSSMSDYECVKVIHDYLVDKVNYDYASLNDGSIESASHPSHTAESALCSNLAVCDGYAQAFELLCAQAGIQAYMMYGEAGTAADGYESHAWNVVKIDGEWYQIDCTWDDPLINGELITDGSNITYKYFLLTDSEMYVDHILDKTETKYEKVCTSTLFKGLGETLSLEAAMGEPGIIVTNAESFYLAITDYTSKSQWNCFIAVPQTETITKEGMEAAVLAGARTFGYNGFSYGYSCTYINVGSYVVYEFDITVTQ